MKNLKPIVLFIVGISFFSCSTEKTKNNLAEENLKGSVKTLTETEFVGIEKKGEFQKQGINSTGITQYNKKGIKVKYNFSGDDLLCTYKYDDNGNRIEDSRFHLDGSLEQKESFKYDVKGNAIHEENFSSNITRLYTYKLDANDNIIEQYSATPDGKFPIKRTFKYDSRRNRIETKIFYTNSNSATTYKYDANGNKIEENLFSDSILILTRKYNANGHQIEEKRFNSDGVLGYDIYKYDFKGNIIENGNYCSDGSLNVKWTSKYNDKGNYIEGNQYNSDGSLKKITYKYDDKDNRIEENQYNSDGSLYSKTSYKYVFDKIGNWIKVNNFENDIQIGCTERKIEYY